MRVRLEDAALATLADGGVDAFSIRAVAARAAVSAGAIYTVFPDKSALFRCAVEKAREQLAAELLRSARGADAGERLWNSGRGYLRFAVNNPGLYQALFMDARRTAWEAADAHQDAGPFLFLTDRVREASESGFLRPDDPTLTAMTLWAAAHGVCSLLITGRLAPAQAETLFDHAVGRLKSGLRAGRDK